ncbi:MAG TPA: hypothetical protein VGC41_03090, partial [Kofleriaceae bacterium]
RRYTDDGHREVTAPDRRLHNFRWCSPPREMMTSYAAINRAGECMVLDLAQLRRIEATHNGFL